MHSIPYLCNKSMIKCIYAHIQSHIYEYFGIRLYEADTKKNFDKLLRGTTKERYNNHVKLQSQSL